MSITHKFYNEEAKETYLNSLNCLSIFKTVTF